MTAERRLAKLESTLTPKTTTLFWLTEAHGFPTLPAYVVWLIDQPASAAPLYRVPEAAETGERATLRGEKRDAVERSVSEAVRQAVFLVELVVGLNTVAEGVRLRRGRSSRRTEINLRQLRAAARARASEEATPLVDAARAAALEALGDTNGAATIAKQRVRTEL